MYKSNIITIIVLISGLNAMNSYASQCIPKLQKRFLEDNPIFHDVKSSKEDDFIRSTFSTIASIKPDKVEPLLEKSLSGAASESVELKKQYSIDEHKYTLHYVVREYQGTEIITVMLGKMDKYGALIYEGRSFYVVREDCSLQLVHTEITSFKEISSGKETELERIKVAHNARPIREKKVVSATNLRYRPRANELIHDQTGKIEGHYFYNFDIPSAYYEFTKISNPTITVKSPSRADLFYRVRAPDFGEDNSIIAINSQNGEYTDTWPSGDTVLIPVKLEEWLGSDVEANDGVLGFSKLDFNRNPNLSYVIKFMAPPNFDHTLLSNHGLQLSDMGSNQYRMDGKTVFIPSLSLPLSKESSEEERKYLGSTEVFQIEDERIVRTVKSLRDSLPAHKRNRKEMTQAIIDFVSKHCHYDPKTMREIEKSGTVYSFIEAQSSSEFLDSKVGVCSDFANLSVTLLRAAGIPAQKVIGLAFFGNKINNHAWIQVKLSNNDQWTPYDPTPGNPNPLVSRGYFPVTISDNNETTPGIVKSVRKLNEPSNSNLEILHRDGENVNPSHQKKSNLFNRLKSRFFGNE